MWTPVLTKRIATVVSQGDTILVETGVERRRLSRSQRLRYRSELRLQPKQQYTVTSAVFPYRRPAIAATSLLKERPMC
jgi:hypothetical protein